jgi:hypothetical protein
MGPEMKMPTVEDVSRAAADLVFGERLIQNNLRSIIAETIIDFALRPSWKHCSGNWNGWDFRHETGTRLEVKQSARRQSWPQNKLSGNPVFDIAPRKGYYDGALWTDDAARLSEIYVFAYHPRDDNEADHRDPSQWRFYVADASKFASNTKSMCFSVLRRLSVETDWEGLLGVVESVRLQLKTSSEAA